jgi:hypothetical protein
MAKATELQKRFLASALIELSMIAKNLISESSCPMQIIAHYVKKALMLNK